MFLFARGRKLTGRDAAILRISLAVLTAIGLKDLLKTMFGRTWPETWVDHNPSFITDHVFTFSPFHGGVGWSSFPSGHETVTAAFCAALWILAPRLRLLCVLMLALVAVGLLGADEHWLSDVFAGGLVGWLARRAGGQGGIAEGGLSRLQFKSRNRCGNRRSSRARVSCGTRIWKAAPSSIACRCKTSVWA